MLCRGMCGFCGLAFRALKLPQAEQNNDALYAAKAGCQRCWPSVSCGCPILNADCHRCTLVRSISRPFVPFPRSQQMSSLRTLCFPGMQAYVLLACSKKHTQRVFRASRSGDLLSFCFGAQEAVSLLKDLGADHDEITTRLQAGGQAIPKVPT